MSISWDGYQWYSPDGSIVYDLDERLKDIQRSATVVVGFDDACDFNVKNYNGVDYTNSAQTVISAALAKAGGGKVILREGVYNTTDEIYVYGVLEGMGRRTQIVSNSTNRNTIRLGTNDTLKNIHLISSATDTSKQCIWLDGDNVTISGCIIEGAPYGIRAISAGIPATGIHHATIINNVITGNTHGIVFTFDTSNCIIAQNRIHNNTSCGIILEGDYTARHNIISNNICYENGLDGIRLLSKTVNSSSPTSNLVIGNRCYNNLGTGIYCRYGMCDSYIGNVLEKNGSHGLNINGTSHTVSGNVSTFNVSQGIRVSEGSYMLVVGNTVYGNGAEAIYVNASNVLVRANKNGSTNIES